MKLSRRHVQCSVGEFTCSHVVCVENAQRQGTCGKYQRKRVGEESVNRVQIPSTGFSKKKFMYE